MKGLLRFISIALMFVVLAALAACTNEEPSTDTPGYADGSETGENIDAQNYVEVSREGTVEKIPVEIVKGVAANYTIAMDPEYFSFSSDGDYDRFTYEEWGGEPSVYYCVYPYYDMTAQELAGGLMHMYSDNYAESYTEQAMIGLYDAIAVYFYDDVNVPGAQMRFYMIDTNYGCIVIEAQFTAEMYEGLYAIMRACFDTFTLIETNEGQEAQSQSTSAQQSLSELHQRITGDGNSFGTAYLGYYEAGFNDVLSEFKTQQYWDDFQFLGELTADRCILAEGAEWYVIVPASEDVKLTVYEYYFDFEKDYIEGVNPGAGREYISVSDGSPVLIRGNISDIIPNLLVRAESKDGSIVEYTPCLSLENGKLSTYSGGVTDLTPYDQMRQFNVETFS